MPSSMNKNLLLVPVLVAAAMVTSQVFGQAGADQPARIIELPAKTELNQFRVSARLGYNITAHLQNVGVSAKTVPEPPQPNDPTKHFESATGVTYLDGYVGIDESGNNPGPGTEPRSFYWGYANASQIAGGNLLLSHSSSGALFEEFKNDPQAGLEISYARQLGQRADGSTYGVETS